MLQRVSEGFVAFYWLDPSDLSLFTISSAGAITEAPYQGTEEVVYEGDGKPFVSAVPSAKGDEVILITGSPSNPTLAVINVITRKRTFLPFTARSATWHPNGRDIVFLRDSDAKNPAGLYLFNLAKGTSSLLGALSLGDVKLFTQNQNSIALVEPPSLLAPSSAWSFDLTKKTLSLITTPQAGFMASWSSFAPFDALAYVPTVGVRAISAKGTAITLTSASLPDKCAFGKYEAAYYCAVMRTVPKGMPDSYLQKAAYSIDSLVAFSRSGESKLLWDSQAKGEPFDATNLKQIGDTLYFINRYDNRLYSFGPIK